MKHFAGTIHWEQISYFWIYSENCSLFFDPSSIWTLFNVWFRNLSSSYLVVIQSFWSSFLKIFLWHHSRNFFFCRSKIIWEKSYMKFFICSDQWRHQDLSRHSFTENFVVSSAVFNTYSWSSVLLGGSKFVLRLSWLKLFSEGSKFGFGPFVRLTRIIEMIGQLLE